MTHSGSGSIALRGVAMFTRAGYNLRGACRWGFWAFVTADGGHSWHWAQVVEFSAGDLAWYSSSGRFLVWGHRLHFGQRFWRSAWLSEYPVSKLK